ncbi:MAG: nucleoside hydrolase [Bacilli bacterium]|nr:nucleoside hydrolase [Bacilli bacterium]
MKRRKIILDCDPGHDDAVAILLCGASPSLELLGITVVSGNQTLEKTARNAWNVSRYLGIDCPIALGASDPLVRTRLNCGEIHGETGLDGFDFPPYSYDYDSRRAPEFIRDLLLKEEQATVITTGPMTNLAQALRDYPQIKGHIDEIILMGGSTGAGNLTPYAEFNILADPDAADICFRAGLPMRMVGLNVTRRAMVLPEVMEQMAKVDTSAGRMFIALMKFFNKTQNEVFGLPAGPLHDPMTIVSLIADGVVKFEPMDVKIILEKDEHYAQTVCTPLTDSKILVATDVDVKAYWGVIEHALRAYK